MLQSSFRNLFASGLLVTGACLAAPAMAQESGIWQTSGSNNLWVTVPVVVGSSDALVLLALDAGEYGDYEAWAGTPAGNDRWNMQAIKFLGADTDLAGIWTEGGDGSAQLEVTACSKLCGPFTRGRRFRFTQILDGSGSAPTPPPGQSSVKPGTYSEETNAYEACLNVSSDGKRLTSAGSRCDNGNALDIDLEDGTSSLGGDCNVNTNSDGPIPIVNGSFKTTVTVNNPFFSGKFTVTGTFDGNSVSGTMTGQGDYIPGICSGNWSANL